ncbi:MAG: type VI secretion system amidase effector protein Tae4 [Myxococcota bacterium]
MKPSLETLKSNYPSVQSPCSDGYANQCALRMSVALDDSGFSFSDYTDPLCSHGHARGAESLANHLWRTWGRPKIYKASSSVKGSLSHSRGIVFFKDISGFREGNGDHIDLWDGNRTMTGEYFSSCNQVWFFGLS